MTSSLPSQPYIITPISCKPWRQQHGSTGDHSTATNLHSSNTTKRHFHSTTTTTTSAQNYSYKILDHIVTSIPYDCMSTIHDTASSDVHQQQPPMGEIYVTMEDCYSNSSSFSYNHDDCCNNNHNNISSPLFRRIAVRSYYTQNSSTSTSNSNNNNIINDSRQQEPIPKIDNSEILHASFTIPIGKLPLSKNDRFQMKHFHASSSSSLHNNTNDNDKFGNGLYTTPSMMKNEVKSHDDFNNTTNNWICWTQFHNTSKQQYCHQKYHLCVLVNPNTIQIFDVFPTIYTPKVSRKNSNNDNHDTLVNNDESGNHVMNKDVNNDHDDIGTTVGEGYTISLPFEASSIFPLPSSSSSSSSGGLIIQRAISIQDEEEYFQQDLVQKGDGYDHHSVHSSFVDDDDDDDNNDDMMKKMTFRTNHNLQIHQSESDWYYPFPSKDTSSSTTKYNTEQDITGGNETQLQIEFKNRNNNPIQDDNLFILQAPACIQDKNDDSIPMATTTTTSTPSARNNEDLQSPSVFRKSSANPPSILNDTIPSIYTLSHPLDEIRPFAILPNSVQGSNDNNGGNNNNYCQRQQFFTNAFEQIISIQQPRVFIPPACSLYSPHYSEGKIGFTLAETKKESNDYSVIWMVTYNTVWKQHSFWVIQNAYLPNQYEPLWKSTSRIFKNSNKANDKSHPYYYSSYWDHSQFLEEKTQEEGGDMEMMMDDHLDEGNGFDNYFRRNETLPFLNLYPHFSATCIYSDMKKDALLTKPFIVDSETGLEEEANYLDIPTSHDPASKVFLATTVEGSGDYILCLLLRAQSNVHNESYPDVSNEAETKRCTNNVLVCYNLAPSSNVEQTNIFWGVKDIFKIPCISAEPIQSTPLDPPSFLLNFESLSNTSKYRNLWWRRHPIKAPRSFDILICRNSLSSLRKRIHQVQSSTELCIYRGHIHVVDCALSHSVDTAHSDAKTAINSSENPMRMLFLRHSVSDCVDIICKQMIPSDDSENCTSFVVIRTKISLLVKSSPATQTALSAIGSALMELSPNEEIRSNLYMFGMKLSLKLRSDVSRLTQHLSLDSSVKRCVDDAEWYTFSSLISLIFRYVLSTSSQEQVDSFLRDIASHQTKIPNNAEDSAWDSLLQSDFHKSFNYDYKDRYFPKLTHVAKTSSTSHLNHTLLTLSPSSFGLMKELHLRKGEEFITSTSICIKIFDALHMSFEEANLTKTSKDFSSMKMIATILIEITKCTKSRDMGDFMNHYWRDLGSFSDIVSSDSSETTYPYSQRLSSFNSPPSFLAILDSIISGKSITPIVLNGVCSIMRALYRLLCILFCSDASMVQDDLIVRQSIDRSLVCALVDEGFDDASRFVELIPPGLAVPLMDALHRCRADPPPPFTTNWPSPAYKLIGRPDLERIHTYLMNSEGLERIQSMKTVKKIIHKASPVTSFFTNDDPDKDGLVPLEKFSAMLFPNDKRIREAARLVRSSRPAFLRVPRAVEVSDHDYERLKQEKLAHLCRRFLALPIGRGMMTLGTLSPLSVESLPIPKLCLSGRMPPTDTTVTLDVSTCISDFKMWPEFHNGVAAGLRLPQSYTATSEFARTWIIYNKSTRAPNRPQNNNPGQINPTPNNEEQDNHSHGGFLMALGLRGHLTALSMTDIVDYLTHGPVTTAVGVLLGMAANKRGSCDPAVSKMLCLHVPALLPPSFAAIDVANATQAAAIAGIGLLYQGSSHRMMTEFLLNEIGKRPTNEQNTHDREAYNLSCGLALGLINLRKGAILSSQEGKYENDETSYLFDLDIDERLHRNIIGGTLNSYITRRNDGPDRPTVGNSGIAADVEKCSRIYEGDMVNIDIAAPGATLALGMIHMMSGNKSVASRLALPDTHFLLDTVRPDFLFLRIVARALILWDTVEPTDEWIKNQIPKVVSKSYEKIRTMTEKSSGLAGLATFAAMTMSEATIQPTDSNEIDEQLDSTMMEIHKDPIAIDSSENVEDCDDFEISTIDKQAIRQAYVYIISGACFALGLRYAGTSNDKAANAIYLRALELHKLREDNDTVTNSLRPERPLLEMCLASLAISLSMVMAGTGDLKAFRLLKLLRWKCDDGVKYGNHMAYNMAIGLLFLGGGTSTLGRDPSDIAVLLVSFFPRFPSTTTDNQYHLQALRHLYALALRQRKVEAIDIDSLETVFLPLEVECEDKSTTKIKAPCLLLDKTEKSMVKIRVLSNRYYPLELSLQPYIQSNQNITLYVKKKAGHLSYVHDPHALRSLLIQTTVGESSNGSALGILRSFMEDKSLVAFANYICPPSINNNHNPQNGITFRNETNSLWMQKWNPFPRTMDEFCSDILHENILKETLESIPIQLYYYDAISNIGKKIWPQGIIWDLRLLRSYYESRLLCNSDEDDHGTISMRRTGCVQPLTLLPHFVASLCESVDRLLDSRSLNERTVLDTWKNVNFNIHLNDDCAIEGEDSKWIGCYLIWNCVECGPK